MDSNFSYDDLDMDDILEDFDDNVLLDNDSDSALEKKAHRGGLSGILKAVASVAIVALVGYGAYNVITDDRESSNNTAQESSTIGQTDDPNVISSAETSAAVKENQEVPMLNAEQISYSKMLCNYANNMTPLKTMPTYDKPARLGVAREDMYNTIYDNVKILDENIKKLEELPQKSLDDAKGIVNNQSITDVYKKIGDSPDAKTTSNTLIITSAMKKYRDALKSMADDLARPATYDAYGLHKAIDKVQQGFDAVNSTYSQEIQNAFTSQNYDNQLTLNAMSQHGDCSIVNMQEASQEDTILLEEQKEIYNQFISNRCEVFLQKSQGNSDSINANRKLCEQKLDEHPAVSVKILFDKENIQSQKDDVENSIDYDILTSGEIISPTNDPSAQPEGQDDSSQQFEPPQEQQDENHEEEHNDNQQ